MIATIGWTEGDVKTGFSGQAAAPANPSHHAIGCGGAAGSRDGGVAVAHGKEEAGAGAPADLSVCRDRSPAAQAGKGIVRGKRKQRSRTSLEEEMKTFLVSLLKDESGLTTVEYAVGAALVVAGLITAFSGLGTAVQNRITGLTNTISG